MIWLLNILILSVTWWKLFQKLVVCSKFDVYLFIDNLLYFILFHSEYYHISFSMHLQELWLSPYMLTNMTLLYNNKYVSWTVIPYYNITMPHWVFTTWRELCGRSTADNHMYPENIMQEFENKNVNIYILINIVTEWTQH